MTEQLHLLLVDDDRDIRESLGAYLETHSFQVCLAEDASAARSWLDRDDVSFDLVILDIMMPGEDGLSLCRKIRASSDLPIILLTALGDDTDRIVGLEIGADDYVVKPVNPREIVARIRAILRRSSTHTPSKNGIVSAAHFGEWTFCRAQNELTRRDGLVVPLSTGESHLLSIFIDHPAQTLSRDDLMRLLKGRTTSPFERGIDKFISRLRQKIEADPKNPRIIKTVWGNGYRFVVLPPTEHI